GARDPGDHPPAEDQQHVACLSACPLRCHNSQQDAPDGKATDAVDPVVAVLGHELHTFHVAVHLEYVPGTNRSTSMVGANLAMVGSSCRRSLMDTSRRARRG